MRVAVLPAPADSTCSAGAADSPGPAASATCGVVAAFPAFVSFEPFAGWERLRFLRPFAAFVVDVRLMRSTTRIE
jgi:hypothetical protein